MSGTGPHSGPAGATDAGAPKARSVARPRARGRAVERSERPAPEGIEKKQPRPNEGDSAGPALLDSSICRMHREPGTMDEHGQEQTYQAEADLRETMARPWRSR